MAFLGTLLMERPIARLAVIGITTALADTFSLGSSTKEAVFLL